MPSRSNGLRRLFCWAAALAFPGLAVGQTVLPTGEEFSITSGLIGDQTAPSLALGVDGGFLAWQANGVDNSGQGVAVLKLNGDLTAVTSPVRVNGTTSGDQELPQVSLLKNGGAVVVWQGSANGKPNIFARFLNPDGGYRTAELRVNYGNYVWTNWVTTNWMAYQANQLVRRKFSFREIISETRESFRNPGVATLTNGDVVVLYSGFRKVRTQTYQPVALTTKVAGREMLESVLQRVSTYADSMQDVMFQRYSPNGVKLGREVVVNSFRSYSQRNPVITALPSGRFVVVWVSEQQVPSAVNPRTVVDIKARLFSASGQPATPEFRVNTVSSQCGTPAVAPLNWNGFTVAWSQFDSLKGSGWDIYARTFASDTPTSDPFRLNDYLPSHQVSPHIATIGKNQFVTWMSPGQDGSFEGVFGRFLSSGEIVGEEMPVNSRTIAPQRQPVVVSDGISRFNLVWSSFVGARSGYDLIANSLENVPPPSPLAAPTVMALSSSSLGARWAAVGDPQLVRYELFIDGAAAPVIVQTNEYVAEKFQPSTTHSFKVRYCLTGGQRAPVSAAGNGTTLGAGDDEGAALAAAQWAGTGGGGGGGAAIPVAGERSARTLRLGLAVDRLGRRLSWNTERGGSYQIQCSTNLAIWSDVGAPRAAAGTTDVLELTERQAAAFYRVIRLR